MTLELSEFRSFASDNHAGVHPEVLQALADANLGFTPAYGADPWTAAAHAQFTREFGEGTQVVFATTGTAANVMALRAALAPYESAICASMAHVSVDECGAPEAWTGTKLLTVPTPDGKLSPEHIASAVEFGGDVHKTQPRLISISQTTEYGTLYTVEEIRELVRFARERELLVHVDGARLANAAVALGKSHRELTRDCGVDLVSFGGTKNGLMGAEALLCFRPELARRVTFLQKQTLQLSSKMRFLSAQFLAYFKDDLWARNAAHANAMTALLAEALKSKSGSSAFQITRKPQANAVFVRLPADKIAALQKAFYFYAWDAKTDPARPEVRWMTSFQTPREWVQELVGML